jgi:hypothetical protein
MILHRELCNRNRFPSRGWLFPRAPPPLESEDETSDSVIRSRLGGIQWVSHPLLLPGPGNK